jgi:class II lanthipeptide synthase
VSRYRDQVSAALAAVTISSPTRYVWLGRASPPLPGVLDAAMDDSKRRAHLLWCLGQELYMSFYCHGRPVPSRRGEAAPPRADPQLVEALSRANRGRGGWEPGWTVERLDGDQAVVATSRLRVAVALGDCHARDGYARPGAAVSVRMPKELPALRPGFFTVVSDAPADLAAAESLVRVYWNVTRTGAPPLVAALTSRLNTERAPFRLKVGDHLFSLDRCDAATLYLPGQEFRALRDPLSEVAATMKAHLQPRIPAFALELAPGVGLSESGGDGESFGVRRCALLAEAIVRSHAEGVTDADARVDAADAHFAAHGVQMDAPYLEPTLAGRHVL